MPHDFSQATGWTNPRASNAFTVAPCVLCGKDAPNVADCITAPIPAQYDQEAIPAGLAGFVPICDKDFGKMQPFQGQVPAEAP